MKKVLLLALLFVALSTGQAFAQKWAVKTNILYDATATINLGTEVALSNRVTLDISGNYGAVEN